MFKMIRFVDDSDFANFSEVELGDSADEVLTCETEADDDDFFCNGWTDVGRSCVSRSHIRV